MRFETDRTILPDLTGKEFAARIMYDQNMAVMNYPGKGENPWDTLSYYIIELEKRIAELENNFADKIAPQEPKIDMKDYSGEI